MIRMTAPLGSLAPGDETARFSEAEEAALVGMGVAEAVAAAPQPEPEQQPEPQHEAGYGGMRKAELQRLATERGLGLPASATRARIVAALEADDEAEG